MAEMAAEIPARVAAKAAAKSASEGKATTVAASAKSRAKKSPPVAAKRNPGRPPLTQKEKTKRAAKRETFAFFSGGGRYSERHYRRILLAAFVVGFLFMLFDEIQNSEPGTTPKFKQFIGYWTIFFMLAFGTVFGTKWAKLSASFGMLIVLAIALTKHNVLTRLLTIGQSQPQGVSP